MNCFESTVIECIKNISVQIEGLSPDSVDVDFQIYGKNSLLDSFSILLLLVELEQTIDPELLRSRSLIEWFSSLDLTSGLELNLRKFTTLLFFDYLGLDKACIKSYGEL